MPASVINGHRWVAQRAPCESDRVRSRRWGSQASRACRRRSATARRASACSTRPESESTDMHHVRGCMFAHRRALQAFVNTTAERFFVFEDDVTLPDAPLAWSRAATSEFVAAAPSGPRLPRPRLRRLAPTRCCGVAPAPRRRSAARWCTSQPSTSIAPAGGQTAGVHARAQRARHPAHVGDASSTSGRRSAATPYECAARKIEESKAHKNSREVVVDGAGGRAVVEARSMRAVVRSAHAR